MKKTYGNWTLLKDLGTRQPYYLRYVLVRCKCGNKKEVLLNNLKHYGNIECKSCSNAKKHRTHGLTKTVEYRCWAAMKQRCLNKNLKDYNNYGGRGIKICKRWLNSFEKFLEDMSKKPSKYHSLDRINNDGNYTPSNCRWATKKQQRNNQRKYFPRRKAA